MSKSLIMKFLLLTIFTIILSFASQAQTQIFNSDFELWDNLGNDTEEPQGWNGLRTATGSLAGNTPQSIARSTQKRPGSAGNYSVRVYTANTLGINANGNLTTGRVNAGSITPNNPGNYNFTVTGNPAFSKTLTDWPDSLVFWARYNPGNAGSQARVRAAIHDDYQYRDPSDAASTSHLVAEAVLNYVSDGAVWKRIAIPFNYVGPATSPQYLLITFTSNMTPGGGSSGDEVFIDDMELKYNPVTTTAGNINPSSYSVSPTQGTNIAVPFTKTGIYHFGNIFTAQLSDAAGSFASAVNIGTLTSTTAGTINGTIPAGTPSGTGYRVRVIASTPYQTANDNGTNISINLASNSVAPAAAQTLPAGVSGTPLTVTETVTATSRVWKFSNTAGGPYGNFSPSVTATTYTPNFGNAGNYYVVCESAFGSLNARSNEVHIQVVKNQVSPGGTQSLLAGQTGTTLNVTETPAGTAREWKFSTTSGGPYASFSPIQTGNNYSPVFASPGLYYVVCESQIAGIPVVSNEVVFSVGSLSITTGGVAGSPFLFSASAPNASVNVPFTVSSAFNAGNTFTAQLSDAAGSFASPVDIGTLTGVNGGSIGASIPAGTPAGTGYLIRVTGSDPAVLGSDNGTALTVDQYNNAISPIAPQNIVYNTPGAPLTVTESQNTTVREWRYSDTPGGPYSAFSPSSAGANFAPVFQAPGVYYVICASTNIYADEVLSNEVMFEVVNGTTLNTGMIDEPPFYVSPSALYVFDVPVNTNVLFDANNVFTVELSNVQGNFATTTAIGTLSGPSPAALTATMPNNTPEGNVYRVRVTSSSPAIVGTPNNENLSVVGFAAQIAPVDTQYVSVGSPIAPVSVTSTHPFVDVNWKYRTAFIGPYNVFNPPETGTVFAYTFTATNTYQVIAECINPWGDTLETGQVVFQVNESPAGIDEINITNPAVYYAAGFVNIDLTNTFFENPTLRLTDMQGRTLCEQNLQGQKPGAIFWQPATGVYVYHIFENGRRVTGRIYVY